MASATDYYEVLGVDRSASPEEIRRAYRSLARQFHPDVNKSGDAEAQFKAVQAAYDVLKDENKRALYDRYGQAGLQPGMESGIAGMDFGGFGDIFDAFFGATPRRESRGPQPGRDLQVDLTIGFMEAIDGVAKEIELSRLDLCSECGGSGEGPDTKTTVCPVCKGSGQIRRAQRSVFGQFINVATCDNCRGAGRLVTNPCSRCGGAGRERRKQSKTFEIPAGVDDGVELRISGVGDSGIRGGPPGDLYVHIRVQPHATLKREGFDIHSVLVIPVTDAILGGDYKLLTVAGEEKVTLEAGTQPGTVVKLRGKGVPRLQRPGRGDHYVTISVQIPRKLSKREQQLYYELKTISDQERRKQDFSGKVREALGR